MFKILFNSLYSTFLKSMLGVFTGVFRGGFSMALNMFKNTLNAAFTSVKSFNQMGVNTSRAIGLGYRDSIAYTQTLITRTKTLSALYGVTADKIAAIQDSLAKATGKAIMLSNAQAEYAVAINKMLGEGAWDEYSKAIIKSMGGSVDASQKAAMGAYAKATRVGLTAAEFSSKVAQNLSMANRVTFRGGVDGITKMTALSERLNFNLQSMEASADVFRNDIQTAIESSAKLQALGGGAALYGSNPLAMMYESMYDMESYTERITKMVNGMATFDAAKGIAEISAQNKEFIRHYSEILKIPYDELASMATNQAKEAFAKNRLGGAFFDNLAGGDEEFKSFIMNKAQWNDKAGRFEITLPGQEDNPIDLNNIAQDEKRMQDLKRAWKDSTLTETEAFLQGARDITSVDERISSIMSVVGAMLAEKLMPYLTVASMWLSKAAPKIATLIGSALQLLITPGFWKNIAVDVLSMLFGGLAGMLQIYIMQKHPAGRILHIVGLIAHAIGSIFRIDWLKNLGKVFDGTGVAEWAADKARSALSGYKDQNALAKQNAVLGQASALFREAKDVFSVANDYASAVERGEQYDYVDALQRVVGDNYRGSGNYQQTQSNIETHRFQTTALRAVEEIRENTRNTSRGIGDLRNDNERLANAQMDAMEDYANNQPTITYTRGANGEVVPQITMPDSEYAYGGGVGAMAMMGMLPDLLGTYMSYRIGKSMLGGIGRRFGFGGGEAAAKSKGIFSRGARYLGRNIARNARSLYAFGNYRIGKFNEGRRMGENVWQAYKGSRVSNIPSNSLRVAQNGKVFNVKQLLNGKNLIKGAGIGTIANIAGGYLDQFVEPGSNVHMLTSAIEYGGLGASIGSMIPVIGTAVGAGIGALYGGIKGFFTAKEERKKEEDRKKALAEYNRQKEQLHGYLGQYGNGFEGAMLTAVSPQAAQFEGGGEVVAAPVGQSEYVYSSSPTQTFPTNTTQTVKVSDITVKVTGTIKLDGGNGNYANLDVNRLLEDRTFMKKLVEYVFDEKNIQSNNGMKKTSLLGAFSEGWLGLNARTAPQV